MKNNDKRFLFFGLGILGVWISSKISAANKLTMRNSSVENVRISGGALNFDVVTLIENLSAQSVTLQGLAGAIFIDSANIGTLQAEANTQIARLTLSPVRCQVYVPILSLLGSSLPTVKKLIKGERVAVTFRGTGRALGFAAPIQDTFYLQLPTAIVNAIS